MTIHSQQQNKQPYPAIFRLALWLFTAVIRLYPTNFQADFGEEMVEIFNLALEDAAEQGTTAVLHCLLQELIEFPVALAMAHIRNKRKNKMTIVSLNNNNELNLVRWIARGLSLLPITFWSTILLFNNDVLTEDILTDINLPLLLNLFLSLCLLIAWRWEKVGGLLAIGGSPLLFSVLLLTNLTAAGLITPYWAVILMSASMAGFYLIVGLLFMSVARHESLVNIPVSPDTEKAQLPRYRLYLLRSILFLGILSVFALFLFISPIFTPVQQHIEAPPVTIGNADTIIQRLRAHGAVVGIGSLPAEQPFTSVQGEILVVNDQEVQLFEYDNTLLATEIASSVYYDNSPGWEQAIASLENAHLYQVGNILLFYTGDDQMVLDLLETAFNPPLASK